MKYLVTGGHGKLGRVLCSLVKCLAPTHSEMGILSLGDIEKYITKHGIGGVIHLAAITSRKAAEDNKPLSYEVNVIGTRNVAQAAAKFNKKITYISTEIVFDGSRGNYREEEAVNPRDWYAFTKYAGELEIQNSGADYLIIRTTFRPSSWGFPTAFSNVYTTGDYVDIIAKEIALCLKINPSGILHLGTPIKTWHKLAQRRSPEVQSEEFPDSTFLRRDLNIEKWGKMKKKYEGRNT